VVKDTLNMHNPYSVTSFEDIVDIDQIAREQASDIINRKF